MLRKLIEMAETRSFFRDNVWQRDMTVEDAIETFDWWESNGLSIRIDVSPRGRILTLSAYDPEHCSGGTADIVLQ